MAELRLRELRKDRKMTQADVAKHLQIARETYTRHESGEREMTYDSLIKLAELYGVSVDYLLGRHNGHPAMLSDSEISLIDTFRKLDERGQRSVAATADYEYLQIK